MGDANRLTQLLTASAPPDSAALLELVYDQLRKIAQQRMSEERREHTLQATALVHEAYLRLAGDAEIAWKNRAHFFSAAAEAMRRILVEHARARNRVKRGHGARRMPINVLDLANEQDSDEILMLDEAICRLEAEDPQAAQVVRLRFFAGLSIDDVAAALNTSPSSVDRDWAYARARLHRFLAD